MKKLLLAALLCLTLAPQADANALKRYKRFHTFVYWPVHVISFVVAGPVIVIASVVQNHDTKLKQQAVAEGSLSEAK